MVRMHAAWKARRMGRGLTAALAGALLAAVLSALGCAQVRTAEELHWIWTGRGPGAPPGFARENRAFKVELRGMELEKVGKLADAVKVYREALRMSDTPFDQATVMADLARVYARQHKQSSAIHEAHAAIAAALSADVPAFNAAVAAACAEASAQAVRWHCSDDAALARLAAASEGDTRTVYSLTLGVSLIHAGRRAAGLAVLRGIRAGPRWVGVVRGVYNLDAHDAGPTQSMPASHAPLPGIGSN